MIPERDVQLRARNFLGLESIADYFARVTTEDELRSTLAWARQHSQPITVLGEGSNVVLRPRIHGLVLIPACNGIRVMADDGQRLRLRVAAGENWHAWVRWSVQQGFYGLENLALIPGSVGAAPVQNIGAYGVEVARSVMSVQAMRTSDGEAVELSAADCVFGYRDSLFKRPEGRGLVITSVDFLLHRSIEPIIAYPSLADRFEGGSVTCRRVYDTVVALRRQRLPDPAVIANVGSFFKNPSVSWHDAEVMSMRWPNMPQYPTGEEKVKLSAAWMIDHLGWRGRQVGGVGVSDQHALVLVNHSARTVAPVLRLAREIEGSVAQEFGVSLQIEPSLVGEPSDTVL